MDNNDDDNVRVIGVGAQARVIVVVAKSPKSIAQQQQTNTAFQTRGMLYNQDNKSKVGIRDIIVE